VLGSAAAGHVHHRDAAGVKGAKKPKSELIMTPSASLVSNGHRHGAAHRHGHHGADATADSIESKKEVHETHTQSRHEAAVAAADSVIPSPEQAAGGFTGEDSMLEVHANVEADESIAAPRGAPLSETLAEIAEMERKLSSIPAAPHQEKKAASPLVHHSAVTAETGKKKPTSTVAELLEARTKTAHKAVAAKAPAAKTATHSLVAEKAKGKADPKAKATAPTDAPVAVAEAPAAARV
jgi:hypothetical protein